LKQQKTIKNEGKMSGKGLFTGKDAKVIFKAAPLDTGIVFVRTDFDEPVKIKAAIENTANQPRRTALQKGDVMIQTVEHCLAAVSALQIDNLIIEINSDELPAGDCGSLQYYNILNKSGVIEQQGTKSEFSINQPISITEDDSAIYALPCDDEYLNITYDLDYGGHTGIGRQIYSCRITPESFEKNLAPARTFLLEAEAKHFQSKGIGKHLSPKDILVINSDGPIKNSFRFPNECVRHKIVDLIGDLALSGLSLQGRIVAYKSGHSLNRKLAEELSKAAQKKQRKSKVGTDALLDIRKIQKTLPHRYPFLLVDKVIEIDNNKKITGIKNVTFNEQFFQGHFPGTPVMPGVLILEALAQISGLLFAQTLEHTGKLAVLLGMDSVKFRKAVVPGDQLVLQSETLREGRRTAQCRCRAIVQDNLCAEADVKFMLVDDEKI
jgi:UDP-3-O-[3-hydroxymyristoyl] N-acetylglucosamine deacetylase/3-hydroxyacyl-[acyl-carrier-protein] dehydratase